MTKYRESTIELARHSQTIWSDLPTQDNTQRNGQVLFTTVVDRLYPRNLASILPRKVRDLHDQLVKPPQASVGPSWEKPVLQESRRCCNLESYLGQPSIYSLCHPVTSILCWRCRLRNIHVAVLCAPMDPDIARSFHKSNDPYLDAYGNSILHFAASRFKGVFPALKALFTRFETSSCVPISHLNEARQSFLFALNPSGLGPDLQDLESLLSLVKAIDFSFDLNHRDLRGRLFLHYLVRHISMPRSSEAIRRLRAVAAQYDIVDFIDNSGHWADCALYTSASHPHCRCTGTNFSWSLVMKYMSPWQSGLDEDYHSRALEALTKIGPAVQGFGSSATPLASGHMVCQCNTYDREGRTLILALLYHFDRRLENTECATWYTLLTRLIQSCFEKSPAGHKFCALDLVDMSGESALFIAVRKGYKRTTRHLLHAGAKYNIENHSGVSLLSAARDELRRARAAVTVLEGTANETAGDEYVTIYCNVMLCMIMVLDHQSGVPLIAAKHI